MSETSTPAGSTGGDNSTSTRPELAELPAKVRVHALAKLLGKSSREVMDALEQLGEGARSAQSSVTKDTALQVADALLGTDEPSAEPSEAAEPVEVEAPPAPARQVPPPTPVFATASPLFLPPTEAPAPVRVKRAEPVADDPVAEPEKADDDVEPADADAGDTADDATDAGDSGDDGDEGTRRRRRRGRRGRGRGKGGADDNGDDTAESADPGDQADEDAKAKDDQDDAKSEKAAEKSDDAEGDDGSKRRRRRRRRKGGGDADSATDDDPPNTVVHVRESRDTKSESGRDEVRSVRGSTRLEAKRQRRRDGREAGRRRAPILSEAEFLARREAVDRTMVVRERPDRTQIAVLEDGVLVEHFVTSAGSGSMVGNVYLGRVQNVLPSMEAAFVDIGRGRNAVLYAGEVDWDAAGLEGKARRIEQALSTGDSVLVQVTKDPVGHKGARLTTQISLPGRFLVYVPGGGATGISRKLPENERRRLKDVLKRIVPEDAGVIIRTASEGISEDELARDVRRLQAQWQVIKDKVDADKANKGKKSSAPTLLYEEPDLLIKVVRDLFTEDFSGLVVQGADAWDTIDAYVRHVAPELAERARRHVGPSDVFAEHRIDEQLLKALDRKVWLPSGGYLVIDRTEAMTVIDVNTGKFTGSGGNLEETVTRNNLESAEEIVRQLRLRDIGGIIVIDFIDMVLESNRDLVLRRLTECLGRDRTRHQVAEVTSLGLVQMTRKRVGMGLLEAFSTPCEHCKGRGVIVSTDLEAPATGGGHQHHGGNGNSGNGGNGKRGRDNGKPAKDRDKDKSADHAAPADSKPASEPPAESAAAWTAPSTVDQQAPATTKSRPEPAAASATKATQADAPATTSAQPDAADASAAQSGATPTDSAKSGSAQAVAAEAGAAQSGTPETDSAGSGSAQLGSARTGAAEAGAPQSGTAQTDSVKSGSAQTGAAGSGAAQSGTAQTDSAQSGSAQTGAADAGAASSAQHGVAQSAAANTDAAQSGEARADTARSGAAQTGAAQADPAQPGAVEADLTGSAQPGAAPTGAAQGESADASQDVSAQADAVPASGAQPEAASSASTEASAADAASGEATPVASAPESVEAPASTEAASVVSAPAEAVSSEAASVESVPAAAAAVSEPEAPARAEAEPAPSEAASAASVAPTGAQAAETDSEASVEGVSSTGRQVARRRRHGKVSRPAGAPAPATVPAAEVSVPPVPEGQSRVLTNPDGPVNGHDTGSVSDAVAPSGDGQDLALPRRHQPRRTVSRPAGPPVHTPGETS